MWRICLINVSVKLTLRSQWFKDKNNIFLSLCYALISLWAHSPHSDIKLLSLQMLENLKTLVHYRCLSRIILSWGMVKAHCKHNLSKSNLSLLHYLRWWAYILIILIFAFATQYHRFPIDLSVSSTITHPMIRRIVFTSLGLWDCAKQKFDRNCLLKNYFFITKWVAHAHQRFFFRVRLN